MMITNQRPLLLFTKANSENFRGGGGHPFFQKPLAEESIDHGTFPRIELTHDHDEKEFIELLDGLLKSLLIFSFNPKAPQCQLEVIHDLPLISEQFFLLWAQQAHG